MASPVRPQSASMLPTVLLAASILFVGCVVLRSTTGKAWEIQLSDAAIALLPIVVWLVATGQLKELQFGSSGFAAKFQEAIAASVASAVEKLPTQPLMLADKEDVSEIPKIIARKQQGLSFVMGERYLPHIAKQYLDQLTQYNFFRFSVIEQNGGAFFGLVDAKILTAYLNQCNGWPAFMDAVANLDEKYLQALPSFMGTPSCVNETAEKSFVLDRMETQHVDWLPITGPDFRLLGVVERSAILARLVLDISKRLNK